MTGHVKTSGAQPPNSPRGLIPAAVINPINLIALALLATPRHTLDEQVLKRLIEHYQALANEAPYAPSSVSCTLESTQIVAYAERLGIAERIPHLLGDLIGIREKRGCHSDLISNNAPHLFRPSIADCLSVEQQSPARHGANQLSDERNLRFDEKNCSCAGNQRIFRRHGRHH